MTQNASRKASQWEIRQLKSPVDGIQIRYAVREGSDPSRIVFFLNGRSEYLEKYFDLPDDTDLASWTWVTMDHRGQGASEGQRSHVADYSHFASDARAVIDQAGKGRPYVMLAHSMGGLITLYGTLLGLLHPQSIVLSSPLFGILAPMPMPIAKALAKIFSYTPLFEKYTGSKVDRRASFTGNILTHSQERFAAMAASPYPTSSPTFGWVYATFKAFKLLFNKVRLKGLTMPIGIMAGSEEKVVDRFVYEEWAKERSEVNQKATALILIPGASHELLNEADEYRDQAISFINKHLK